MVSVAPGATVGRRFGLMSLHDVSQLPVMDGANCVGSVSDWSLSQKSLENPKLLDTTVSEIMDSPFPMVAWRPAGRQRREAAVQIESCRSGAGARRRAGHRDAVRHAAFHDVALIKGK